MKKKKYVIAIFLGILVIAAIISAYAIITFLNRQDEANNNDNNISASENIVNESNNMKESSLKINITIKDQTFTATLEDNDTAREFAKLLPLDLIMEDLNDNEKYYYYLNTSLPSNPADVDMIYTGDIMLYGNDCLVLFYDTFKTNYVYTRIGRIDNPNDLKHAVGSGNISVSISKE